MAAVATPSVNFDVAGARSAGYSDAEIASYLGSQANFDTDAARKYGYDDGTIINYLTAPPKTSDSGQATEAPTSSATGAFARSAEAGTLPAAGGMAAAGTGAEMGAVAGAAVPVLGETGISETIGALAGGIAGYFGGSTAVDKAQNWILDHLPADMRKAIGQDAAQRQADIEQHPYASMAGDIAPNLLFLRPGAVAQAAEDAPKFAKALANPVTARVLGAGIGGAGEAANEYEQGNGVDPVKVAIAAGAGALMNRQTRLGEAVSDFGAAPIRLFTPRAETSAVPVLEADNVDDAIAAANTMVGENGGTEASPLEALADELSKPLDVAEGSGVEQGADTGVLEPGEHLPDQEQLEAAIEPQAVSDRAGVEQTAQPVAEGLSADDAGIRAKFLETGEEPPVAQTQPSQILPRPLEPQYSDAAGRAATLSRWLGELDAERRAAADASPQANLLRQTANSILGKVNGVEDRLTNTAATRLATVRQALSDLLSPVGDNADMAQVRTALVAEHQRMADAAAVRPKERVLAQDEAQRAGVAPEDAPVIAAQKIAEFRATPEADIVADTHEAAIDRDLQRLPQDDYDRLESFQVPAAGNEPEPDGGAGAQHEAAAVARIAAARPQAEPEVADVGGEGIGGPEGNRGLPLAPDAANVEAQHPAIEAKGPTEPLFAKRTPEDSATPRDGSAPAPRAKALKATQGTGEFKPYGLSKNIEAAAVEKGLIQSFGDDIPLRQRVDFSDQANKIAGLIAKRSADDVRQMALGHKATPAGIVPELLANEVERRAHAEGNVDLLREMASSPLTKQASEYGLRMRALAERDQTSPVNAIKSVADAREAVYRQKSGEEPAITRQREMERFSTVRQSARKSATVKPSWASFAAEIMCRT